MLYDFITLAILAFATFRGAQKGFVWQLATISGLIICFVFAETVSVAVMPHIGVEPPLSRWIAIFGLYVASSFVAFAIARNLRGYIEKAKFKEFDNHLGGVFGFIKGVTFSLIVSFFAVTLSADSREVVLSSNSGYASAVILRALQPVLPDELEGLITPQLQHFDPETIAENIDKKKAEQGSETKEPGKTEEPPLFTRDQLEQLVESELYDPELEQLILQAFKNTKQENWPELVQKLRSGIPGLMRKTATDWLNGKPAEVPVEDESQLQRSTWLQEIAAVYSDFPEAQELIVEEIAISLDGIPNRVTTGVLDDWHADLMGRDPDPDMHTNLTTSLDARILRQLAESRIAINTLDADLQARLMNSLQR